MSLVLHPRLTSQSDKCIQVWLGVFERTTTPTLEWFLNGQLAFPQIVRSLDSVRPLELVAFDEQHAFSGVYQFNNLTSGTRFSIEVRGGAESAKLDVRTLPSVVTDRIGEWFNILLISCFHQAEDRQGLAGEVLSRIPLSLRPHMALLMGDQVYLDLPTLQDFKDDVRWLARKFERDYTCNWRGPDGFAKLLSAAPAVSMPDDHEYWNNFPHASLWVGNSWTKEGRERWTHAARMMYRGYQLAAPGVVGDHLVVNVPPLSIFVADTRSLRDPDNMRMLKPNGVQPILDWVRDVAARNQFGVFVTGQSMFDKPVSSLQGKFADYALANYREYPNLVRALDRLADASREVVWITGDVHWGRVAEAMNRTNPARKIYEVISSPTSLVTTVGYDQFAQVKSFVTGLFGNKDPWPRHADADDVPAFLAREVLGSKYGCVKYHGQKGNHVAVLSFRRVGFGLDMRVTYFPIHQDVQYCQPAEINIPRLGPK
jgi:hypothetical protein